MNEKKKTKIDVDALSAKLGCPVINTVSTSAKGLKALVEAAVSLAGKAQQAPYHQGDIDLSDKAVVEAADKARFEFINGIVKTVETRKVFTKERNFGAAWMPILGWSILLFVIAIFTIMIIRKNKLLKAEYSLKV